MAYDRPSWKEIDRMRDGSGKRKKSQRENEKLEHSTRYDKYKSDLNRLFDQGMAGELLKRMGKPDSSANEKVKERVQEKAKNRKSTLRRSGRIPSDSSKSSSRFKLIRAVVDAQDRDGLIDSLNALVERFGLPDDWDVLARVLEHPDEGLLRQGVERMGQLLELGVKVSRRASVKERLRTISQTASDFDLRQAASDLESRL